MLLNSQEIQKANIVKNSSDRNFKESSYNLRIGKIITHEGKILELVDLQPQGLITVISEEELHVPKDTLLIATVKNGLSQKGVLALNIGLIDSGWEGPINSTIINFGKGLYTLKKGDVFLRVTAYKYNSLPEDLRDPILTYNQEHYLHKTVTDIRAYLGEKFLSLDQTSKEVEKNVENSIWEGVKRIASLFGLVSVVALVFTFATFFIGRVSDTKELNNKMIKIENDNGYQNEKMQALENRMEQERQEFNRKLDEILKRMKDDEN